MESSQPEKAKGPVYFSKFTLQDYLRTKTMNNRNPPGPTPKDYLHAANKLRPTAQPFFPPLQLNPRANEFSPRRAESFVEVRSLDYEEVKARIPVDPLSPVIRLVELEKYFPLTKGIFFFTIEKSGEKRLISVIRSCSFSDEEKQTGKIGDIKFLLPEGLDRTYYVTEKFLETEELSNTADLIQQVGDMKSLLERSLDNLSRLQDRMKMMESQAWDQMNPATLDESGYVDFYQQDYDETVCEVTGPQLNMGGQFNFSVAEFKREISGNLKTR